MKIRMLETQRGAEDGVTLRTYETGVEYDLGHTAGARDLAAVFVREGWAEQVAAPPSPRALEPEAPLLARAQAPAEAPVPLATAEARESPAAPPRAEDARPGNRRRRGG